MSISAFNLGVLGMLAQGDKMAVIGNNIANSQTCSYKAKATQFEELFVTNAGQSVNGVSIQYGNGVKVAGTTSDWSSGSLEETSSPGNLAIEGEGFLAVKYPDQDEILYSRAGDFALTAAPSQLNGGEGYVLMRPNGVVLCGINENSTGVTNIGTDGVLTEDQAPIVFTAQKCIEVVPATVPATYTWRAWNTTTDGEVPSPTSFSISAEGKVECTPTTPENPEAGDYRIVLQAGGTAPTDPIANPPLTAVVAVQRFNNPDSLQENAGGIYNLTDKTSALNNEDGDARASLPNLNGCGKTQQGMLEGSNVDLVTEFTNMIITQRAYQANSKTITTADQMLQTVMQLKQ